MFHISWGKVALKNILFSYFRLTSGLDNTLFHYVHMDKVDGVYICPTQQETSYLSGPINALLIHQFYQGCLIIRQVFEKAVSDAKVSYIQFYQRGVYTYFCYTLLGLKISCEVWFQIKFKCDSWFGQLSVIVISCLYFFVICDSLIDLSVKRYSLVFFCE